MKTISQPMQDHLDSQVLTTCRCWILKRKDGVEIGFTDHDEDIGLLGVACAAEAAWDSSKIEQTLGFGVNSQDVFSALNAPSISEDEIEAGAFEGAEVRQYVVNWSDPGQYFHSTTHLIGRITFSDGYFRAELQSITARMDQTKGERFIKSCQADLGDALCSVDLDQPQFSQSGLVTEVRSPIVLVVSGLGGFNAGLFKGGRMSWTSGGNTGRDIEVAEHITQFDLVMLHLWQPMPAVPDIGDGFLVTAGCDKSFSTCRDRFQNSVNFRGFPYMPGNDFVSSYATNSNQMDGGPFIE